MFHHKTIRHINVKRPRLHTTAVHLYNLWTEIVKIMSTPPSRCFITPFCFQVTFRSFSPDSTSSHFRWLRRRGLIALQCRCCFWRGFPGPAYKPTQHWVWLCLLGPSSAPTPRWQTQVLELWRLKKHRLPQKWMLNIVTMTSVTWNWQPIFGGILSRTVSLCGWVPSSLRLYSVWFDVKKLTLAVFSSLGLGQHILLLFDVNC